MYILTRPARPRACLPSSGIASGAIPPRVHRFLVRAAGKEAPDGREKAQGASVGAEGAGCRDGGGGDAHDDGCYKGDGGGAVAGVPGSRGEERTIEGGGSA